MVLTAIREESTTNVQQQAFRGWSGEAVAFCPGCKSLQTVSVDGGRLGRVHKYYQKGNQVYHDCGSSRPCRLFRAR